MKGKEPITAYERKPGMYPYPRPETSYLLAETEGSIVFPLNFASGSHGFLDSELDSGRGLRKVNAMLYDLGLPTLEERVPVVGYGSNANPDILTRGFKRREISATVPTFRGSTIEFDVVHAAYVPKAASIPAQIAHSEGTEPEVWLNLLDENQVRVMHETEKLGEGSYFLGLMKFTFENGFRIMAYGYFGGEKGTYIDPETERPIALASSEYTGEDGTLVAGRDFVPVDAKNRRFAERTQTEMMDIFDVETFEKFGEFLYKSPGILTEWGEENRSVASKHIEEKYGRVLPVSAERVESPYDMNSLKRLKDLV